MKKLLIALAAIIGGGVIVVLIAQAEAQDEWEFVGKGQTFHQGLESGRGNSPEQEAKSEEAVKQYLLEEYWQKKEAEGQ